jgi:hypothetical protein
VESLVLIEKFIYNLNNPYYNHNIGYKMLKEVINKNKGIRKIFGKKEIEIILKQLDGIELTQSEKNRLRTILISFSPNIFLIPLFLLITSFNIL